MHESCKEVPCSRLLLAPALSVEAAAVHVPASTCPAAPCPDFPYPDFPPPLLARPAQVLWEPGSSRRSSRSQLGSEGGAACEAPTPTYVSTLWGPTCDSADYITKDVVLPRLGLGDWLLFPRCGAYTIAGACDFNGILMTQPRKFFVFSDSAVDADAEASDEDCLSDLSEEEEEGALYSDSEDEGEEAVAEEAC